MRLKPTYAVVAVLLSHYPLWADSPVRDRCMKLNDATACLAAAGELAGKPSTPATYKAIHAEMTDLYHHGCDLGNNDCCQAFANQLALGGKRKDGIDLFQKLCDQGVRQSCQSAAYWLEQEGRKDDARKRLMKECLDTKPSQGCEDLAKLCDTPENRKLLQDRCDQNQTPACYTLAMALKRSGDRDKAKSLFMRICNEHPDELGSCGGALDLIEVPKDVADLLAAADECHHWRGEDAYDAERGKEIEQGIRRTCQHGVADFEKLEQKYQTQPEVAFKLKQAVRLYEVESLRQGD